MKLYCVTWTSEELGLCASPSLSQSCQLTADCADLDLSCQSVLVVGGAEGGQRRVTARGLCLPAMHYTRGHKECHQDVMRPMPCESSHAKDNLAGLEMMGQYANRYCHLGLGSARGGRCLPHACELHSDCGLVSVEGAQVYEGSCVRGECSYAKSEALSRMADDRMRTEVLLEVFRHMRVEGEETIKRRRKRHSEGEL